MNLFKTLAMVGLVGDGMVVKAHCLEAGTDVKGDCTKAEAIIFVSYDRNRAENLVFDYLYGKDSSAAQLVSLEFKEETRFPKKCELIVFARYIKGDMQNVGSIPDQVFVYSIQGKQVMVPNGKNVTLDELKEWIREKERLDYKK
jgi:hypothetical protein